MKLFSFIVIAVQQKKMGKYRNLYYENKAKNF